MRLKIRDPFNAYGVVLYRFVEGTVTEIWPDLITMNKPMAEEASMSAWICLQQRGEEKFHDELIGIEKGEGLGL